ncbi:carbon-nitrogen hydrolase family protein [Rhodohalobacter barkolensis]|uniref:Carbon-nitrogen hydrolase family protein n=1 Tax=Rhodohalobacter barkolensis TaxID=2053187 RepID=A0A2N0VHQ0_9BACT|nr:carbon-nitrogen hydrolase family protein [Rhodohalobacter barkolensis]PKD43717.1 carbon-nitrogen hydrolase family protein [Rhodohalobacter barkolensis]
MTPGSVTISLAQIPVIKGALKENVKIHLSYISESSYFGADVVVFPELSLTGYELELADQLSFQQEPNEFRVLSESSVEYNIVVIAGCPLINKKSKPSIGAVICFPNGDIEFYSKQYLHTGEDAYCSTGTEDYLFSINKHRIALAICADYSNPRHSANAVTNGADMYVASALISEPAYQADARILSNIASGYKIPVLLSNHISQTGGWPACGKNTVWDSSGEVVITSGDKDECIVLCTFFDDSFNGTIEKTTVG